MSRSSFNRKKNIKKTEKLKKVFKSPSPQIKHFHPKILLDEEREMRPLSRCKKNLNFLAEKKEKLKIKL